MIGETVDVAVIGAGPAGLAAAIKARESGAEHVTIIERAEQPGGLLHQCIHNGFGLTYFKQDMTGPEYARRFIEKAMDLKVDLMLESMVVDLTAARNIYISNKQGLKTLHAKAVILAMGCRERTRHQILIPGTRPAGIFTAGTAQRYVNVEGYIPGKRVVILGSGDVGLIMARRLTLEGVKVEAVVEVLPYVGGLIRNEVQCIHDFNIPLFLEHTVAEIHGLKRVEGVTITKIDGDLKPIPGTEKYIECDTLLTSVGLIPENELSLKAGVELDPVTGGPVVNYIMETSIAGIFAGGNVVHVNDLVDNVTLESEMAGAGAASRATGKLPSDWRKISLKAGENVRYIVPHTICAQKETTISLRVREPAEKVTVIIGNVLTKSMRVVKPSEMLKINLAFACTAPAPPTPTPTPAPAPAPTPAPAPAPAKTLDIGLLVSLTGWFSAYDTTQLRECQVVADMWNEKGGITIQGQKYNINLIAEDCKSTLDGVTAATNKLIYDKQVKFIAGPGAFFGAATTAIAEPAKVIRCLGYCTLFPDELSAKTQYAFLGRDGSAEYALADATYMKELYPNVKTVVYLVPDDGSIPAVEPVVKKTLANLGFQWVATISYNSAQFDFAPIVSKVISINPDALFQANGMAQHAGAVLKGLREAGWDKPYGTCIPSAADVLKIAGKAAGTNFYSAGYLPGHPSNPPVEEEIGKRIAAKYPDQPLNLGTTSSLWALLEVIKQAQSLDTTVVKNYWEKIDTISGTVFGIQRMGGLQTYGIRHAFANPVCF